MLPKSITFRNYRSFGSSGAKLQFGHEFTAVIGVNNSGKSTVLKAFYELRPIFATLALNAVDRSLHDTLLGLRSVPLSLSPGERLQPIQNPLLEPRITLELHAQEGRDVQEFTIIITKEGFTRYELKLKDGTHLKDFKALDRRRDAKGNLFLRIKFADESSYVFSWEPVGKVFHTLANSMYVGPFRNAINSGGADYYDLAIGKDFITRFDNFKTGPDTEDNEAVGAMFYELAQIFGFDRLDISASSDKSQLVFMVDGKSQRASELGAGISQFVIVAANILVRKPDLLLVDEPELNLHASLQLRFLTLLGRYVEHGVFFSTHSLGLARSAADRILVAARKEDNTTYLKEYEAIASLSSALGELGYGGLNDSAYKAVLLVEGVTDVRTYQQLLTKYGVRNEVVIIPLGGDDLAAGDHSQELLELTRLSDKIFAIADSEREAVVDPVAKRREEFRAACYELSIDCHLLDRRAIENYLDQNVAREILGESNLTDFGHFDKPWPAWSKERNWRIARDMERGALDGTDLSVFLGRIADFIEN